MIEASNDDYMAEALRLAAESLQGTPNAEMIAQLDAYARTTSNYQEAVLVIAISAVNSYAAGLFMANGQSRAAALEDLAGTQAIIAAGAALPPD